MTYSTHSLQEGDLEEEVDWLTMAKRRQLLLLEDNESKSQRLREEGTTLAEAGRLWEAIKYWDEALELTPYCATLHEMKCQVCSMCSGMIQLVLCALGAQTWPENRTQIGLCTGLYLLAANGQMIWPLLSQVLLELGEVFPAVRSGERAVELEPTWGVARQTLGRAQLGLGEVHMVSDCWKYAELTQESGSRKLYLHEN